jgi:hypothetical protein
MMRAIKPPADRTAKRADAPVLRIVRAADRTATRAPVPADRVAVRAKA